MSSVISQADIFSTIASYLKRADNFVNTVADAYRLPVTIKQASGIITSDMIVNLECISRDLSIITRSTLSRDEIKTIKGLVGSLPITAALAEWFLREYYNIPNMIASAMFERLVDVYNGDDEISVALKIIDDCPIKASESVHCINLCRYDVILDAYTTHFIHPGVLIGDLIHDRKDLAKMVRHIGDQRMACNLCGYAKSIKEYEAIIYEVSSYYEYTYPFPPIPDNLR